MNDAIRCPVCEAELRLPSSATGRSVQCPRCQRVFELLDRASSAVAVVAPIASRRASASEDHELFEPAPVLVPLHPPAGGLFAIVTMILLAATVVPVSMLAYTEIETFDLRTQGLAAVRDGRWRAHSRFQKEVAFWIQVTAWPALIAFLIWSFVAAHNARCLQATGFLPWSTLVVGVLCIPVVNVMVAYLNLQEIWRASDPYEVDEPDSWRRVPASWWIRAWGFTFFLPPSLVFVCFQLDRASRDYDNAVSILFIAANVIVVTANVLLIAIIRSVTSRQRQRFSRLYEDPT